MQIHIPSQKKMTKIDNVMYVRFLKCKTIYNKINLFKSNPILAAFICGFCLYLFQAMVSVLCCGPCFDDAITEDDTLYNFLDSLLEYHDPKVTYIFTFT